MELLVKERFLLLTAISMVVASCESGVDFSVPVPADQRFEEFKNLECKKILR